VAVQAWLFRHGQTEWSRDGRHTGRTDLPLTAKGDDEARALVPVVAGLDLDLVLCSPRSRAVRTAELSGLSTRARMEVTEDLAEWDYGEFEGRTTADIQEELPGWSIWDGPWRGGETAPDVSARADRVLSSLPERLGSGDGRVAMVGHGHFSRVLAARWVGEAVAAGRWLLLDTATWCLLGDDRGVPAVRHWNVPAAATPPA
jgi:broad specificity phosphatase PhoE